MIPGIIESSTIIQNNLKRIINSLKNPSKLEKCIADFNDHKFSSPEITFLKLQNEYNRKDLTEVLNILNNPKNKGIINPKNEEVIKKYIKKVQGTKAEQILFKVKESILYLFNISTKAKIDAYFKNKSEEIIIHLDRLARLRFDNLKRYSDLTDQEKIKIAKENLEGISASKLKERYALSTKSIIYQTNKFYKKGVLRGDYKNQGLLDSLNKKSYKDLTKEEIISIHKKSKKYYFTSDFLATYYDLKNKQVVYKVNKSMKSFSKGLEVLIPPSSDKEEKVISEKIVNLEEYRNIA